MNKEELRTRVNAELLTGANPKELSKRYGISYTTVFTWSKKLLAEKPTEDISKLTNQTVASLEIIKDKAKEEAPIVAKKIDKIIDGVVGLKELEPEFQSALHRAVSIAHEFLDEVDEETGKSALSIKEWQTITNTLGNVYGTLFNKSGTTVNVAQTNIDSASENLAFFRASTKAV